MGDYYAKTGDDNQQGTDYDTSRNSTGTWGSKRGQTAIRKRWQGYTRPARPEQKRVFKISRHW
jgi:hypothetical protein